MGPTILPLVESLSLSRRSGGPYLRGFIIGGSTVPRTSFFSRLFSTPIDMIHVLCSTVPESVVPYSNSPVGTAGGKHILMEWVPPQSMHCHVVVLCSTNRHIYTRVKANTILKKELRNK